MINNYLYMSEPEDGDFMKNFALMMPNKALSHKSGKPMLFIPPERKKWFVKYCFENGITDENTTHEQRDEIYLKWLESLEL